MLAKSVVRGYGAKAEFVEETFSESTLAKKFGIKFYPAIFVNEVLIAKPSDFFGKQTGRYIPWREPANQEKFRADLIRMIEIAMRDRGELAAQGVTPDSTDASSVASMPEFSVADLTGAAINPASLRGKATIIEFWAEWCPPCRGTLAWLAETQKKHAANLQVLGLAVESEEADVRAIVDSLKLPYPNAMGSAEIALQFGDVVSVPTLFIFDRTGKTVGVFYGAPPDLHEKVGEAILLATR